MAICSITMPLVVKGSICIRSEKCMKNIVGASFSAAAYIYLEPISTSWEISKASGARTIGDLINADEVSTFRKSHNPYKSSRAPRE